MNNMNFKRVEFDALKNASGSNFFILKNSMYRKLNILNLQQKR